jgi:alpha-galactosidase
MDFMVTNLSNKEHITLTEKTVDGVTYLDIHLTADKKMLLSNFKIKFSFPDIECYSTWSPFIGQSRHLGPNWGKRHTGSRLAHGMPVHSLVSADGNNSLCIAISDVKTPTNIATGVREENAEFECEVSFFTTPTTPLTEYNATIRIDRRKIPFYDCIYDVSAWWEKFYTPAFVPEDAKMPMNSLWYSFHQNLVPEEIIKQCELSKPLGMDAVIIDDGWQTDDNNRGYAYCGDWEVCKNKIPDMKALVDSIHKTGMKVMLWYSVPFVGGYSKAYEKFKDMLLYEWSNNAFCLDPRYKEVRDYLCETYENAIKNSNLDGLKLDFIDTFALKGKGLEYDEKRDFESLEDAIDTLMKDVNARLHAINPDVLIEFRQPYVGPAIRCYGNMLRVGDCPSDAIRNRVAIVDLRLTSGNTAVHSDMIMWNYNDSVESASLQFSNILYSVPQFSMLIDKLSKEHLKMSKYYLSFWREHRDILLDGKLTAKCTESSYSKVTATLDGKSVVTLYADKSVEITDNYTVIVNASPYKSVFVKGAKGKTVKTVNCMGEELRNSTINNDIEEIMLPMGAMAFLK